LTAQRISPEGTGPDTRARIGRTPNKPICVLHADDGEDLAAAQIGG
jgi:hypothetical protein